MKKMSNGNTMQQQCVCYFVYTAYTKVPKQPMGAIHSKIPPRQVGSAILTCFTPGTRVRGYSRNTSPIPFLPLYYTLLQHAWTGPTGPQAELWSL